MGALLGELGKKLAERWLSLLVLPGALYLAVALAARTLGQAHPFDLYRLASRITGWAKAPVAGSPGGQVVLLGAVLGGAAGVGLIAQALGSLAERIHLAADWHTWPAPLRALARRATDRRTHRWLPRARAWHGLRNDAGEARALARLSRPGPAPGTASVDTADGDSADEDADLRLARSAMVRVSPEPPERPTWSGDRVNAAALRLERDQHLDLAVLWPHLWLVLPDTVRTEITAARQGLTRATGLSAWALLYLLLVVWWWPAALVAAALALAGRHRTRAAADGYATLVEAAARLRTRDLAAHLGVDPASRSTQELNELLMLHLTASAPPDPGPEPAPGPAATAPQPAPAPAPGPAAGAPRPTPGATAPESP
ncbi:hypothetical protein ACIRS1_29395 [Kitasatospora sp. NPDC101176]|uniref:hypothetical protein n=1 Tax=Kitasatospora sp. NPDC101176 TaxID=3364099 RepID=UPI0038192268